MPELTFVTIIKNEMKNKAVTLFQNGGNAFNVLGPGKGRKLESWNPLSVYSQFSSILYKEDGVVELVDNPDWPRPEGKWILTAINIEGRPCETRIIGGHEIALPRGIPRLVVTELADDRCAFSRLEIRKVTERSGVREDDPRYSAFVRVTKDVWVERPKSEIDAQMVECEKYLDLSEK